jgi:hypothetical protein
VAASKQAVLVQAAKNNTAHTSPFQVIGREIKVSLPSIRHPFMETVRQRYQPFMEMAYQTLVTRL